MRSVTRVWARTATRRPQSRSCHPLRRRWRRRWLASGWTELGAVAIERIGLQPQLPGQHVGFAAFLHGGAVGHVDGLGNGARDEGLHRRHHADMRFHAQRALADAPAGIGAVEHRQMSRLSDRARLPGSWRRRHRGWRRRYRRLEKPSAFSMSKSGASICGGVQLQHLAAEFLAQGPFVEDKADVEGRFQRRLDLADLLFAKALAAQRVVG